MKLTKLQLENFRNYHRYELEFEDGKDLMLITGPNGKGKTNILEAIFTLSLGRSFRAVKQEDLIQWEMDYFRCMGEVKIGDEIRPLEVSYSTYPAKKKVFKVNEVNKKNSEFIGNLLTVLFHPEDLNILYLGPALRRKYMDILLSQTDREYLTALLNFTKILKQRSALLPEIREKRYAHKDITELVRDLRAWSDKMAEFGAVIITKRQELNEFLNKKLTKIYQSISGGKEKIRSEYSSKVSGKDRAEILKKYHKETIDRLERDVLQARTTCGPHRDDLIFYIDDKEISTSASRGEYRTLLLAIKVAEIEYIKETTGENPVLLLDDVFSELDENRQEKLTKSLDGCQAIITTTELNKLQKTAKESESMQLVEVV